MSEKIIYNKLIRDRIPEILESKSKRYEIRTLDNESYKRSLRAKLLEEAQEVSEAPDSESLAEELADVLEVFEALLKAEGLKLEDIQRLQLEKRLERGGFEGGLELLWVEEAS